jgi:hypothetical protein
MPIIQYVTVITLVMAELLLGGGASAQQNPTLAGILKQEGVPLPPSEIPHRDSQVTSYAALNDDREFLIAYYLDNPENELRFPLFLTLFDKRSTKWHHVELSDVKVNIFAGTDYELPDDCLGSVLSVKRDHASYYLDIHLTPSAGCLLILKQDLSVSQTLDGWTAGFFKSGLLVYSGDMVHFADVHPETLFLYDPVTKKRLQLYPPKHDPFRDDFSTRLEKVIDHNRCAENNWACEPDRFATVIDSIEVNDETKSLAFRASFETEGFLMRDQAETTDQWDDDQYAYIYQLHPLRWREFSIYDLKPKFGTDSLREMLAPAKLKQVFSTPAP